MDTNWKIAVWGSVHKPGGPQTKSGKIRPCWKSQTLKYLVWAASPAAVVLPGSEASVSLLGNVMAFAMTLLTLPGSDICMLRCTYITSRCPWCCQCYLELQKLELELGASSRVLRGTQEGKLTSQGSEVRKCQSPAWMLAQCLVCVHHRNHGQKTLARHLWTRIWKIQICILTSMEACQIDLGTTAHSQPKLLHQGCC